MDKRIIAALGCTLILGASPAWSHGGDSTKAKQRAIVETPFGKTGDPNKVDRTIVVDMSDRMRFAPATIKVKQGETIRFDIRNSGKVLHEMVLGTMKELKEHVGHEVGPIAKPASIDFVETLPKTRSGKIMRRLLKARELGLPEGDTSTLEGSP